MNEPLRRARELRKNLTEPERRIWTALRNRRFFGFKFRRQVPLGRYVVDFVCCERKLILELDGGQHNEPAAQQYDAERTAYLAREGYRVIRVWNHEVWEDREAIEELLWQRLQEAAS